MPDLKDELRQLADEAACQAQPLSVTDVIREGDRRSRRTVLPRRRESGGTPDLPGRARPPRRWPGWVTPLAAAVAVIAVVAVTASVSGALRDPGPAGHRPNVSTIYAVYDTAYPSKDANVHGTIVPISTATGALGKPIRIPGVYTGTAVTPNGKTIYAATDGTITPISTASGKPGKPIRIHPPGSFSLTMINLTMDPAGKTLYVSDGMNKIIPVNTATNKPGKPIRVSGADEVAFAPDGKTAYAFGRDGKGLNSITPIDTATSALGKPFHVSVGADINPIVFAPDGKTAYVAGYDTVTPVNLAADMPGKPIHIQRYPVSMTVTPNGETVYVGTAKDGTTAVVPISTATNTAGKPIPLGGRSPDEMAIAPDGKTVYISNWEGPPGAVVPISTVTNTAGHPILVGQGVGIGIAPGSKTLYAAAAGPDPKLPNRHDRVRIVPISTVSNTPGKPVRLSIRVGSPANVIIPGMLTSGEVLG